MQLILRRLVFTKIGELVTEIIEVLDELLKFLLLGVWPVDEFEVLLLNVVKASRHPFSLNSDVSEHLLHLSLVCLTQLRPNFKDSWLEVTINIGNAWLLSWDSLSGGFRSLYLSLLLLYFATFSTFFFSLFALLFFLSNFTDSLEFLLFCRL